VTRILITTLILFGCVSVVAAQTTGRLQGVVKDPSGGVLAGATVTLRNARTGVERKATTDEAGRYSFLSVEAGAYEIEAELTGFKKYLQTGVNLALNQVADVTITMTVGDLTESVTVTDDAAQIEVSSTQVGNVVNSRAVVGLPLASRDTYQLLQLQAGVQSQIGSDLFFGSDKAGVVSVNGGRGRSNNYTVNGSDGNDLFANLPVVEPSPDSIQEFRVLANTFDAEFGRNSGSIINVVTKSGSNEYHGSVYEFLRNDVLNARGFFDTEKPAFKQNQFGGTFGGPIVKDRAFFFASYEGQRISRGVSSDVVTVPTAAERLGDFSADDTFGGGVADQFTADLLSTRIFGHPGMIAPGTSYTDLFAGNVIPLSAFDPVALNLLNQFVPFGNLGDGLFQSSPTGTVRGDSFTVRADQVLTEHQTLSEYYFFNDQTIIQPFARFQAGGATLPGFGTRTLQRIQQFNVSHTWTINDTSVNEIRVSYLRESQGDLNHPLNTALVSSYGFNNADGSDRTGITPGLGADREGVPFIDVGGAFSIGNNFEGELPQTGNTYQFVDNFSKVIGSHSLKFGGDVRHQRFDQFLYFDVNGEFFYSASSSNTTGSALADYLLGLPDFYLQGAAQSEAIRTNSFYFYGQDSWKIKPNLTLNYGLRYELNTPLADDNEHVQTFRPGQPTTVYPCQLADGSDCNPGSRNEDVFPLGLVVPGDTGIPKGLTQTYTKGFAPRIGIAYSPDAQSGFAKKLFGGPGLSKISTGFGVFYNPIEQLVLEQFSAEPPFGGSSGISNPNFSRPFRLQDGSIAPNPFNGVLNPIPGQPVDWSVFRPILLFGQLQPDIRTQYSEQYNLTFERELPGDLLFSIAYVGSQGHRLLATRDLNAANPQTCLDLRHLRAVLGDHSIGCGPFGEDSAYVVPRIPAGSRLTLPNGFVINGPYNHPITLVGLRPYSSPLCDPFTGNGCPKDGIPVFTNIFSQSTIASSNYHSLQLQLTKRFSHGFQFLGAYTWSKSIDNASSFENLLHPTDDRRTRSLSLFDARHRFVFSYVWELPLKSVAGFEKLPDRLRDGWTVTGILTFQTGFPIRITDTQSDNSLLQSFDFESSDQPDQLAPLRLLDPRENDRLFFDPSSFGPEPLGQVGSAPRTVCCGPGIENVDFSVQKHTPITERVNLEFRAEFFNIANHAQFLNPDGNFEDGDEFGRIFRVRDPRLIQFALKLSF
jgi:hypothetical protein